MCELSLSLSLDLHVALICPFCRTSRGRKTNHRLPLHPMAVNIPGLAAAALCCAPYHLVCDKDFKLLSVGTTLTLVAPELAIGCDIRQMLKVRANSETYLCGPYG